MTKGNKVDQFQHNYEELDLERARTIAHPVRFSILALLMFERGIYRSKDIAENLQKPANLVAYHLKILENKGFIERASVPEADGREVWWKATSTDAFVIPGAQAEMMMVGEEVAHLQAESMHQRYIHAVREGIVGRHESIEEHVSVNLTVEEAQQVYAKLRAAVDDVLAHRDSNPGSLKDLSYVAEVRLYARAENSDRGRESRSESHSQPSSRGGS
ncbi:winged helix-turn-helix transcriptional regulator [Arcanobacterium haemolyticum]|nr:winged helix-turn-helix transcriptional regulator [Arcanobacterium haemolyticum]